MTSGQNVARENEIPYRLKFEEDLFEPEFVSLMNDDEEQLVVSRWMG
jgi:hypothetical protein